MIHKLPNLTVQCDCKQSYSPGPKAIVTLTDEVIFGITRASRVSGLEAFSRYPTHGSFWPMVFRPNQFTGRARPWFLSY